MIGSESALGFYGVSELMNVHPIFVHFPIALLSSAVICYWLGSALKQEGLCRAAKWMLWFGTVAAAITVWTGLAAERTVPHGADAHEIIELHEKVGIVTLVFSGLLSLWVLVSRADVPSFGRPLFFVALAFLALMVVQTADLGGRLVFQHGVGVGRKSFVEQNGTTGSGHSHYEEHEHHHH